MIYPPPVPQILPTSLLTQLYVLSLFIYTYIIYEHINSAIYVIMCACVVKNRIYTVLQLYIISK